MSKIKVSSVTKGQPPCPGPAPKPIPMPRPAPTDAPRPFPPPPPFFMPGPCCPSATQVVDNITVQSLDPEKIDVVEGTYLGMKAFGIDAKTFEGIGTTGMVPAPKEGDEGKVLTSTGEWSEFVVELPQSDWKQEDSEQPDYIKNKPELAKVATTGSYNDLKDKPTIVQSDWEQNDSTKEDFIKNKPELATVATTGSYNDLKDKPTIVQSDWAQDDDTQEDFIKNKPGVYTGSDAGLVPPGTVDDHEKFLRGDGSWETVITDMPDFVGATENEDGVRGVVPAPLTGEHDKYLKGDGTWAAADAELDETSNRPVSNRAVTRALKNFGGFTKVDGTGPNHEPDVENPSSKIIYLVTVNDSPDPDHSIEWIWDEDNESWECIGTTSIQYGLVIVDETGEVTGTSMTVFVANDTYTKFEVPATVKTLVVEMGTVAVTGPVSNSMFEFTLPSDTALETVVVVDGDGIDKTALAPMSWPGTVTYQGRITNGIANIIGYSPVIYNGQWLSTNNGQIITTSTGKHIKYAI